MQCQPLHLLRFHINLHRRTKTYGNDEALLDQQGQLLAPRPPLEELLGRVVGGGVNVGKGQAVGLEDGLHARGSSDYVRGAGSQGGEEVEGRVVLPHLEFGHDSFSAMKLGGGVERVFAVVFGRVCFGGGGLEASKQ